MADKINMVFGPARWNGISKTRNFKEIRSSTSKEDDFWKFTEDIPDLGEQMIFLDLGCGPGREASAVAPKVCQYYGVDVHPELISIAEKHYKGIANISFTVNNGQDLKIFSNGMFDYVYERLLFIHIPKQTIEGYFLECERILKPGGILYVPDLPNDEYWHNGLTKNEVLNLLSNFSNVDIREVGNTFTLKATR